MKSKPGNTNTPKRIVPDYKPYQLEEIAQEALRGAEAYILGKRVDIEGLIAGHHKIRIEAFYDLRSKANCYAFSDITGTTIFVDAELMDDEYGEKKYRFTLAEELAHTLIHKPVYGKCKTIEERLRCQHAMDEIDLSYLESNAKALAGAILMPKAWIEAVVALVIPAHKAKFGYINEAELLKTCSRDFDVNFNCAKKRLRDLGYGYSHSLKLK